MWTLGETLRQARLDKGVSVAEAARETRIRGAYLEALEAEDQAALPPPVYTRGFLRTYAEYLGLNPQAMIDLYQPAARREGSPALRPAVPRVAIPRQLPVRPVLIALGLLIGVVLLGWGWSWYQNVQAAVREEQGVRPVPRGTPTALVRQPTVQIALSPVASPSPSPSPPPTATPEPTPAPSATPVVDGILVEFRTTARVYVEAAADGKPVLAETLPPGSERTLPLASQTVVLRANNGSALDITVNGARQEPQPTADPVEFTWSR